MSLQAGNDLELMFDVAQEEISLGEVPGACGGQVPKVGKPFERLDGFLGAQPRILSAINQGERLKDKLEFANSAVPKFDVAFDQIGRAKFRLDLMFHRAQLAQRVEIEIAAIDEAAEFIEQLAAELKRSGDRSRAQKSRTLPRLSVRLIKGQRALDRNRQRRIAPARPQAHVDPKAFAGEKFGDDFADACGGGT